MIRKFFCKFQLLCIPIMMNLMAMFVLLLLILLIFTQTLLLLVLKMPNILYMQLMNTKTNLKNVIQNMLIRLMAVILSMKNL